MGFTCIHNIRIPTLPSSQTKHFFLTTTTTNPPSNLTLPRAPPRHSTLSLARRRTTSSGRPVTPKKKKSQSKKDSNKDEDEDAFEALFKQLEEDLKKDGDFIDDGEDDISEEELAMLERELEEALAVDEDLSVVLNMTRDDAVGKEEVVLENEMEDEVGDDDETDYDEGDEEEDDEEEEEEEEDEPIKLRSWQLRRLAYALKVGRRKTNIKNLSADLCLDRAIVLELLRNPPPNLLMTCAALPDKPEPFIPVSDSVAIAEAESESAKSEDIAESAKPEPKVETPIHVLQGSWSAQKRLKKVQVETLENVYKRSKRPTNAMISSIVHVTNLPRRRVVKWFEDKRASDGVPEEHTPFRRSTSETVFTQ